MNKKSFTIPVVFVLLSLILALFVTIRVSAGPAPSDPPPDLTSQGSLGSVVQITNDLAKDYYWPNISGDGEWVIYPDWGPLYVRPSDASAPAQQVADIIHSSFDVTTDGALVYSGYVTGPDTTRLYYYRDGTETNLTPCVSHAELGEMCLYTEGSVAISGDGKWVFFNSSNAWPCEAIFDYTWKWVCDKSYVQANRDTEIWRVAANGSDDPLRLTDVPVTAYFSGADNLVTDLTGSKVVFSCEDCGDDGDYLYVVNSDGTGQQKLAPIHKDTYVSDPRISDDGNWITFLGNASGQWGLDVIRTDGTDHRQIIRDDSPDRGTPMDYDINYDGSEIAFHGLLWSAPSCYQLNTFLIDNDGSNLRCAISGLGQYQNIEDLRFSHGGNMVFVSDDDLLGNGAADYKSQVFVYLAPAAKRVSVANALIGDRLDYSVTFSNVEASNLSASLTDPIPENTVYVPDSVSATKGAATYNAEQNRITWSNSLVPGERVTITFGVTTTCSAEPPPPTMVKNQASAAVGGQSYTPRAITTVELPPKDLAALENNPSNGARDVPIESGGNGVLLQWQDQAGSLTCGTSSTDDVAYRVYIRSGGTSWQEVGSYPNCDRQVQLSVNDLSCQDDGDPEKYEWKVTAYDPEFVCREPVESEFSFTTASCRPTVEVEPAFTLASSYFLDNQSVNNRVRAYVDWNGPAYATADTTPPYGTVFFDLNGAQASEDGLSWGAQHDYDMGSDFQSDFSCGNNTLRVWAKYPIQGGEFKSLETTIQPTVFPFPGWVDWLEDLSLGSFNTKESAPIVEYVYEFSYPEEPFEATWDVPDMVPYLGGKELGILETQATADAEGRSSGAGSVGLSGQTGLGLGVLKSEGIVWGRGNAQFVCGESLDFEGADMGFSIHATVEEEASLADLIPGLKSASDWPVVGRIIRWVIDAAKVTGSFTPGVEISTSFEEQNGQLVFVQGEGTGSIDNKVTLSTEICEDLTASVYGGGKPYFIIQVPKAPDYLKEVGVDLYYGAEFEAWGFDGEYQYVINCKYPPGVCQEVEDEETLKAMLGGSVWRLMPRDYVEAGYGVLAIQPSLRVGSVLQATGTTTETVLIPVAYARPEPALAVRGDGYRLLAYVQDDVVKPHGRGTEIHLLAGDGVWNTTPITVTDDQLPDFAPTVAFDGNDHGLVVWERADLSAGITPTLDITFAQSLEIAYAVYTTTTEAWTGPFTLTTNSLMDHAPRLSVGQDGAVMALWQTNDGTDVLGTATHPLTFTYATWDGAAWSAPSAAITGLQDVVDAAFAAYSSTRAALVYVVDADGLMTGTTDTDLYYSTFDGATWSSPAQIADSAAITDVTPALAYDANGDHHLLWLRGGDLVWLNNSWDMNDVQTVRPASTEGGFMGLALDRDSNGNLGLIWQAMDADGADLAYTIYDPTADLWGADQTLMADADVETAHSPAFGDGTLYLAYQKVETELVTRTYDISPTLNFTVTGASAPGTNALAFLAHTVGRDLSFDSLTVTPMNPSAGQSVTLTAVLRNTGDLAVENPQVAFYDDATPVGSVQTLPTLAAGYTTTVEVAWTVPAPAAAHVLSAVADPAGLVTETDENNNEITLLTTLPDLKVEVLYTTQDASAITATARLVNAGVLTASAPFTVAFRAADPLTGTLLGTTLVESDLAAGDRLTTTLTITDPTSLAGLGDILWAIADDGDVVIETNEDNNTAYAPLAVLPDLMLSAADIYGSGPVTVTVHNAGLVTATGATLAVWQDVFGTVSTLVYSGTLGDLGPGASSATTLTLESGEMELWAQADPTNSIVESDESNNLAVRTVVVESVNWIYLPLVLRDFGP
ncbi:MAG: DUF11 domain-containing protein [Chloroflexi bacterium]|nr:DUF11 domain-containing protein [Chloroflexota bacterium]